MSIVPSVVEFADGDVVAVTVDWLGVPLGAQGHVRGFAYEQPVSYYVEFQTGVYAVPAVHMVRSLPQLDISAEARRRESVVV